MLLTKKYFLVFLSIFVPVVSAQNNLDFYLKYGTSNSPSLSEYKNLKDINKIQSELNSAENSGFNVFLSADYLFAPYFNNNGKLISVDPDPKAIGYDIGITNGGLYSAQLNVEKNIFNGGLMDALQNQNKIQSEQFSYNFDLEKHNLEKQIIDQYLTANKSLQLFYLSKDVVSNLSDQLNIASDLVQQGLLTAQNYLLMKMELQGERINMSESYHSYLDDLTQLNTLCGIKDTSTIFLDSVKLTLSPEKGSFDFFKKYELDSLSLINQQELFETKYLPQLKLFFNTGLNAVEINGIERKFGLSAGLNFSLPIFDGGQKSLTLQQNQISLKTVKNYRLFFSSNLEQILRNSSSKIKTLKQNLDDLNSQITDYQKLLGFSFNDLQKGNISTIEYLSILKDFIEMKKNKIAMETEYQMEINNYNYWNW